MRVHPKWLENPTLQYLMTLLPNSYCVGGCVRDAIIGRDCNDIDIATSAYPTAVEAILRHESNITLYPTGLDHGTWTVKVENDTYEVTTFRKDVATDGRRATVEFGSMEDDARRRDFTMNSLYMNASGQVFDPTGDGVADLLARRLRFVGDADARCREDYLRVLRLFRFHAHLGVGTMDEESLKAAADAALHITKHVSGERIWSELKKVLSAPDPTQALYHMRTTGVLDALLPYARFPHEVSKVVGAEQVLNLDPDWRRRYVALVPSGRIDYPCAKHEKQHTETVAQDRKSAVSPEACGYELRDWSRAVNRFSLGVADNGHVVPFEDWRERIHVGIDAECPVTGDDLIEAGVSGKGIGILLKVASLQYLDSGFTATKEELLDRISRARNA